MSLTGLNLQIEQLVSTDEGVGYIDAIVHFADKLDKEMEDIVEMLHPFILAKLKTEFIKKNFFLDKKIVNSMEEFFSYE